MADVFMYADETGNLDYDVAGSHSRYFGIGTATWTGEHGSYLWQGAQLRIQQARLGVSHPGGYHAKDDDHSTRAEVYALIRQQAPRFDTTFLAKDLAYPHVRAGGEGYLYKLAWYLHFKEIAKQVTHVNDTLHVVVATIGTRTRRRAFARAIDEVCEQNTPDERLVTVAHWDTATSWGLQVADYGLWAVQRQLERGDDRYMWAVQPTLCTEFHPWERALRSSGATVRLEEEPKPGRQSGQPSCRPAILDAGRGEDEDILLEVMDYAVGWASAHRRL